jgi:hypothetical protein
LADDIQQKLDQLSVEQLALMEDHSQQYSSYLTMFNLHFGHDAKLQFINSQIADLQSDKEKYFKAWQVNKLYVRSLPQLKSQSLKRTGLK